MFEQFDDLKLHLSSALKLLCYPAKQVTLGFDSLHLSSALKLRCYSGIGYKKDRAPVASVRCTSTALHGCNRHAASMHPAVALVQCTSTTLRHGHSGQGPAERVLHLFSALQILLR